MILLVPRFVLYRGKIVVMLSETDALVFKTDVSIFAYSSAF